MEVICGICDRDRSGNPGPVSGRNCNGEPGFLDFCGGNLGWPKSKKIAQKGIFVILRNAVFLENEKKSAPDLYRRDDRHGKRL